MKKVIVVTMCFILLSATVLLISCSKKTNNSNNTSGSTGTPTVTSSAGSTGNVSVTGTGDTGSAGNTGSAGTANGNTFTVDDLKKYTGQNGSAAYVAVSGTVYDVTHEKRWNNGQHEDGVVAGVDLTEAMPNSPHGNDVLKGLPVVGTITK